MMPDMSISQYLQTLQTNLDTGKATEHTHRPALQALLEALLADFQIINEPRREKGNAPDFIITRAELKIGYVETKTIGASLDAPETIAQITRYREALDNIVLTNYLEFRWYTRAQAQPQLTVRIAELDGTKLIPSADTFSALEKLIQAFVEAEVLVLGSPPELAQKMAKIADLLKDKLLENYEIENAHGNLHQQLHSFRSVLLDSLSPAEFADMYAQTVCYGLFAAKCTLIGAKLSRFNAAHSIPKTNPFLRNLFDQIAGINMDARLTWAVEHLIEVLNHSDIAAILADFGKHTRQEDPVVHFYETFLAAYDPTLREVRGVYYTPEPVVSYIVRSLDGILKSHFGLKDGLACRDKLDNGSHKVQILDPATGTGTFLYALFNLIHERFLRKKGAWRSYVSEHLLPRVHGFEFLMAPYTVAHMKVGLQLQETGYEFESDERLRLFLTNTLEDAHANTQSLMAQWLSDEANAANQIKSETPVMVILGNPPYSGHSANPSKRGNRLTAIGEKLQDYYQVDGKPLGEKNPKWLQDDYVKFIRFAQWKITETGYGVLGFVTNHGYLDNPTFRGMRQSLMRDFDEIYILDLHGNSKKKEKAPDGSADKNVFDIQQGVAIGIFVKHRNLPGFENLEGLAKVFHAELWGNRAGKYTWLYEQELKTTEWTELQPDTPFYLFKPQNIDLRKEYTTFWKVTEMMPVNVLGFQTHRDNFAIDFDKTVIKQRIEEMRDKRMSDFEFAFKYQLKDNRDWQLAEARKFLRSDEAWESKVIECAYRPFDKRFCYFDEVAMDYPRKELKAHVLGKENLALGVGRQGKAVSDPVWNLLTVSRHPIDANIFRRGGVNVFPLYIYPQNGHANGDSTNDAFELETERRVNFAPKFVSQLEKTLNIQFIPENSIISRSHAPHGNAETPRCGALPKNIGAEDVFYYMYAIFHSPTYRNRYAEFLKIDFPRLPLTSDLALFLKLAELGAELVNIHLMETDLGDIAGYSIEGDNIVEKPEYRDARVYLNKTQYFAPVSQEVWDFHIGGYQVAQKWLKDRKGRELKVDDIEHYLYMLAALEKTIELMERIDEVIPEFPLP
jgi:predicted helicase